MSISTSTSKTCSKVHRLIREGKIKAKSEKEVPVMFGLSDEAPNFPHGGMVDFTDNRVDVNTGSLRFRATVRNEKGILTPGLFVRVRLPIGDPHATLFVREEALASDQGRKIVYTVEWKPGFRGRQAGLRRKCDGAPKRPKNRKWAGLSLSSHSRSARSATASEPSNRALLPPIR